MILDFFGGGDPKSLEMADKYYSRTWTVGSYCFIVIFTRTKMMCLRNLTITKYIYLHKNSRLEPSPGESVPCGKATHQKSLVD